MTHCAQPGHNHRLGRTLAALTCLWLGLSAHTALAQMDNLKELVPDVLQETFFGPKPYRIELLGELPPGVKDVLLSVSEIASLQDRSPATPEMLERRARSDIPRMLRALRSEGFYAGHIKVRVDFETTPPTVLFDVTTGPAYLLSALIFDGPTSEQGFVFPTPSAASVGLELGARARAPEIEEGAARFAASLQEHGYPSPWVKLREALVDHESRTMTLHYAFNPGPYALFGPTVIDGNERVRPAYFQKKLPWIEGQAYQSSLLRKLRSELMQDGLFTVVNVAPGPQISSPGDDDQNTLPVTITVVERVPRTAKAGLGYETDTGLGAILDWEHRNMFGQGERLTTRLVIAEKEQAFSTAYRMPTFLEQNQALEFSGEIGRQETDTYDKKGGGVAATVFRQLGEHWTASLGAKFRLSETTQFGETNTYGLVSIPGELTWDKRNDVLNPTRGWRAFIKAEPYVDILETDTQFFKLFGGVIVYVPLLPEDRLVFAVRGGAGSIMGESTRGLPPDERFYAGGGGSIRGYAYQSIGPEEHGEVVGGRSLVETGIELRMRMAEKFGLVAFLDGGQVFNESRLQWEDDFFWGAGLGLRYFTDFAPIRLDLAFPLNRRDKDDAFQVYVSIGQAF